PALSTLLLSSLLLFPSRWRAGLTRRLSFPARWRAGLTRRRSPRPLGFRRPRRLRGWERERSHRGGGDTLRRRLGGRLWLGAPSAATPRISDRGLPTTVAP